MSLVIFKDRASKNELVRQRRQDTMVQMLMNDAFKQNTCTCTHWGIRHLRMFGTACKEKGCKCWRFNSPVTVPRGTAWSRFTTRIKKLFTRKSSVANGESNKSS